MKTKIVLALVVFVSFAAAADRQIISKHITVEEGETLTFAPGAEVLFGDMAGITVKGRLEALGTKLQPIKFASVNDTLGSATPFDWNGIEVIGFGRAALSNAHISGATSGVSSDRPRSLTLEDCVFENNGQWHLSVAGEIQEVPDGLPYNFPVAAPPAPAKAPDDDISQDLPAVETTVSADAGRKTKKMSPIKLTLRISTATLTVGGLAGGLYFTKKIGDMEKKYKSAKSTLEIENARNELKDTEDKYVPLQNTSYILGAVSLAGFTITLFF